MSSPEPRRPKRHRKAAERRQPGRFRRWLLRPLMWLLLVVALLAAGLLALVRTGPVREQVRVLLEQEVGRYLEREIRISEVSYRLLPLTLEARGVVISGPEPGDPAVLSASRVLIEADFRQRRKPTLELNRLEVERPQLYLEIGEDGAHNLPTVGRREPGKETWLDVRIGELRVIDGVFQLNELQTPLDLAAVGIEARLSGGDRGVLSGAVTAEEVEVTLPEARPFAFTLAAAVRIEPGRVELTSARLGSPELQAALSGTVLIGDRQEIHLAGTVDTGTALPVRLGYLEPGLVSGPLQLELAFDWQPERWGYQGSFTSPRIVAEGRDLHRLAGTFSGDRAGLHVDLEEARYAGGSVSGALHLMIEPEPNLAELSLNFRRLWLEDVLADQGIPLAGVAGELSGLLNYRFEVTHPQQGDGWGDLYLAAARVGWRDRVAVTGSAPFLIERGVVTSEAVRLRLPEQGVTAQVIYDLAPREGEIHFQVASRDLGVLARLMPGDEDGQEPLWLPDAGTGSLIGVMLLRPERVTSDIDMQLHDVVSPGLAADRVQGTLRLSPAGLEDLRLEIGRDGGALLVTGSVPFEEEHEAEIPFRFTLDGQDWPVADAGPWLPFELPLEGQFSGGLELWGTLERMEGRLRAMLTSAAAYGLPIGELRGLLAWDDDRLVVEEATAISEAGMISGAGSFELDSQRLDFEIAGERLDLGREPFAGLIPGDLAGFLAVRATLGGTPERPELDAAVSGHSLVLAGRELGPAGAAELEMRWDGRELAVAGSLLGLIEFEGGGPLDMVTADLELRVESQELRGLVQAMVAETVPEFEGRLAGTLRVSGAFAEPQEIVAALTLAELSLGYRALTLSQIEPAVLRLQESRLWIDSIFLGDGAQSELFVMGQVRLEEGLPLDLRLQTSIDSAWLELLMPDVRMSGSFDALASVRGTLGDPLVSGQGEMRRGRIIYADFPHSFDEVRAVVLFSAREVILDSFRASVAGGTLLAGGSVRQSAEARPLTYQIQIQARRLSLRYPEGWLLRGDADLSFVSLDNGRQIRGSVNLDRAFYLQDMDMGLTQLGRRLFQRQRIEVLEADEELARTQLNILVRAPAALRIRNNLANLTGDADFTIRGTMARPVVFGSVEVDPGGRIVFADTEYRVQRGVLTFANPFRIDPIVDMVATADVRNYDITLTLQGTMERLTTSFAADPPLSEVEILGLLTTGEFLPGTRQMETAAGEEVPGFDAEAILFRQAAALIGQRVNTLFGLDKFRVDPLTSTGETGSFARVTLGKRLTQSVFATYSLDPASTENQVLQLEWQVTGQLVLVFTQNGDGSYSTDALWERRF